MVRKIKDISKGKWQRFCKLYDNIMKDIYVLLFLLYTFKRKTDIIKELINMNNIFFLYKGKSWKGIKIWESFILSCFSPFGLLFIYLFIFIVVQVQ